MLGVTFDFLLSFDTHISTLCKKVARQINVLRRIGRYMPISCRKVIYTSFIQSNFNFCPVIWHFCSEANNKKLEKLNYRALRHVYQDYESNYEALLSKDQSVSLNLMRQRQIAEEVYKILNKQSLSYLFDLFSNRDTGHNLRGGNLKLPHCRTVAYGKKVSVTNGLVCGISFHSV